MYSTWAHGGIHVRHDMRPRFGAFRVAVVAAKRCVSALVRSARAFRLQSRTYSCTEVQFVHAHAFRFLSTGLVTVQPCTALYGPVRPCTALPTVIALIRLTVHPIYG
jgi:hypothetical protein